MEKEESRPAVGGAVDDHWWWLAASTAQLGWGISAVRKGYAGDSFFMPFKAAAVGTLFVGAFASAVVASFRASGIHSVKDAKAFGTNIKNALGLPSQAGDE